MKNLKLIENKIAFRFLEDINNKGFSGKTDSGIIVQRGDENQVNQPRWGLAIKCSESVRDVKEGEYILVESLGWTTGLELPEVSEEPFWVTTEAKVMVVSEEEPKIL